MTSQLIDLDAQPEVVVELAAHVDVSDAGPVLVWSNPRQALTGLGRMAGAAVRVFLMRGKKRSSAQNRYYFGVVLKTIYGALHAQAIALGERAPFESVMELHGAFKWLFLGVTVRSLPGGEQMEVPPTSAHLTTSQFNTYIERVCAWAAERGIYVPQPNEQEAA